MHGETGEQRVVGGHGEAGSGERTDYRTRRGDRGGGAAIAPCPPLPRRLRMRIAPQPAAFATRGVFECDQRGIAGVATEHPGPAVGDLRAVRVARRRRARWRACARKRRSPCTSTLTMRAAMRSASARRAAAAYGCPRSGASIQASRTRSSRRSTRTVIVSPSCTATTLPASVVASAEDASSTAAIVATIAPSQHLPVPVGSLRPFTSPLPPRRSHRAVAGAAAHMRRPTRRRPGRHSCPTFALSEVMTAASSSSVHVAGPRSRAIVDSQRSTGVSHAAFPDLVAPPPGAAAPRVRARCRALGRPGASGDVPPTQRSPSRPRAGRPRRRRTTTTSIPSRLYGGLVRIQTVAVSDARSNATLGREREGTGTVIAKGGLVLTDRLPDDRGRRDQGHRQPRAQLPGTRARLRPRDRARPPQGHRAVQRRAGEDGIVREARRPRAGADRRVGRPSGHRARLRGVAPAVLGKLGIPARRGDLHQPADDGLERRRARGSQGQARGRRLAGRPRCDRRRAQAAGQHVRADRRAEADPRGPDPRRPAQGGAAPLARRGGRRSAGAAHRLAGVARQSRRRSGTADRRHHPRGGRRGREVAVRVLPQGVVEAGRPARRSRCACCRAWTSRSSRSARSIASSTSSRCTPTDGRAGIRPENALPVPAGPAADPSAGPPPPLSYNACFCPLAAGSRPRCSSTPSRSSSARSCCSSSSRSIAKQILPWFGGSAAVWTTCLVFFQTALLPATRTPTSTVRRLTPARAGAAARRAARGQPRCCCRSCPARSGSRRATRIRLADPRPARRDDRPAVLPAVDDEPAGAGVVRAPLPAAQPVPAVRAVESRVAARAARLSVPARAMESRRARRRSAGPAGYVALRRAVRRAGSPACASRVQRSSRRRRTAGPGLPPPVTDPRTTRRRPSRASCSGARSPRRLGAAARRHRTTSRRTSPSVPLLWIVPLTLYLLTFILCFDGTGLVPARHLPGDDRRRRSA